MNATVNELKTHTGTLFTLCATASHPHVRLQSWLAYTATHHRARCQGYRKRWFVLHNGVLSYYV